MQRAYSWRTVGLRLGPRCRGAVGEKERPLKNSAVHSVPTAHGSPQGCAGTSNPLLTPGCCAHPHRGPLALPRAVPRRCVQTHGAVLGLRAWAAAQLQHHLPGAAEHPQAASVRPAGFSSGGLCLPCGASFPAQLTAGAALHRPGPQPPAPARLPGPPLASRNNKPLCRLVLLACAPTGGSVLGGTEEGGRACSRGRAHVVRGAVRMSV